MPARLASRIRALVQVPAVLLPVQIPANTGRAPWLRVTHVRLLDGVPTPWLWPGLAPITADVQGGGRKSVPPCKYGCKIHTTNLFLKKVYSQVKSSTTNGVTRMGKSVENTSAGLHSSSHQKASSEVHHAT